MKRTILRPAGLAAIWIFAILTLANAQLVTSPRPMAGEADRLQRIYGKPVTYEDPLWAWREEISRFGWPKDLAFRRPIDSDSDPTPEGASQKMLAQTLDAYHQQTLGPRFQIVTSSWGVHIVPLQVRDENGQFAPARNVLDARVDVPVQERTATEHFESLCAALSGLLGLTIRYFDGTVSLRPDVPSGFEQHFAAQPARFVWGTSGQPARDAIIGLLSRSATTFSWKLLCENGATPQERLCVLNVVPIEVTVKDTAGHSFNRTLQHDRCPKCAPSLAPRSR
jgi:hypothetical protein